VNFSNALTASVSSPNFFAMIEDDRLFEKTAHIRRRPDADHVRDEV
jgi:hypothetical protein